MRRYCILYGLFGVGGEDVRLGDLDALYDCVEARYRLSSGEEHKAERALLDAICEMPTIQAIPMDWMDAQIRGYAATLKSTELKALIIVKGLWEMEQEAR